MVQRAEANTDAKIGFTTQGFDQREDYFARGETGVFTGLDIDIGDARRTMIDQEFRKLIMFGAETGEVAGCRGACRSSRNFHGRN